MATNGVRAHRNGTKPTNGKKHLPPARFRNVEPVELIPQEHGGALRRGGTNPGAGRPPGEFKKLCQELASGEKTIKNVRSILANPKHRQFIAALRWASEHGYGKPVQPVDHSGSLALDIRRAEELKLARERAAGRR